MDQLTYKRYSINEISNRNLSKSVTKFVQFSEVTTHENT